MLKSDEKLLERSEADSGGESYQRQQHRREIERVASQRNAEWDRIIQAMAARSWLSRSTVNARSSRSDPSRS
jgi:hypothetical protein